MLFTPFEFKIAKPIWLENYEGEMNRTALFTASLTKGKNTVLHITAQNTYQVFINGKFVFFGPSRASHGYYRVDHLPIGKYLTKKENEISVLVSGYHCHNFYLVSELAFFVCEATDGDKVFLATGTDAWQSYLYEQKLQKVERYAYQRPFCEVYDFQTKSPLQTGEKASQKVYDNFGNTFIEREVSYPAFPYEKGTLIEGGNVQKLDTPRPFSTWWSAQIGKSYHGFLNSELEFNSTEYVGYLDLIKSDKRICKTLKTDSYITYEMKCNLTGLVKIEISAKSDTTIALTFDELLSNGKVDYARMECANVIVYKLKGGEKYSLLTAEPYTFKYMNVISVGGEATIDLLGVIRCDFNEKEIIKKIKPSADAQIKRIYNAALETFRQNTYDIYMDCPSRERAGWLCDSFFTSRVENLMSGKSRVEHAFLSNFLMAGQYPRVPDGMLPMCYPADHTDGNFIPNWAMWYVLELKEYFLRTGDEEFVLSAREAVYRLVEYFRGFENENGLLEKLKGWVFVEWSRCNSLTQDINYPTNMLYYKFKKTVGALYDDLSLMCEADELKEAINKEAKIGEFYCDNAVYDADGVAKLSGEITETAQYYAFFTGIADKVTNKELWDTMIRDFGSKRKQDNKWENVHFSNAFIGNYLRLDLLKSAGLKEELEADIRGYFDYMAKTTGTLWEYDSTCASCNHGFASHVLVWLDYLGYLE
ncbi:MAG: hypothetical protein E7602_08020 [Ruminococcaceae bacterium]|nr:hypothetical protein [Oscillospiraceae bacterium]